MKKEINTDRLLEKIITSEIDMSQPNEEVPIYTGKFDLVNGDGSVECEGRIVFRWLVNQEVWFEGNAADVNFSAAITFQAGSNSQLLIDGVKFGEVIILSWSISSSLRGVRISGIVEGNCVFGDCSVGTKEVFFSVPNFVEFIGNPVMVSSGDLDWPINNRLEFEFPQGKIVLDKCRDADERTKQLKAAGGFHLTAFGKFVANKRVFPQGDYLKLAVPFNSFLSLVNGRKTAMMFAQGREGDETLWIDYTAINLAPYKTVVRWVVHTEVSELPALWKKFHELYSSDGGADFLKTAVHWYNEANGNAGLVEGSLIMIHTALELIYNWWIVNDLALIQGDDADKIGAANKTRLILSQVGLDTKVPKHFESLLKFSDPTTGYTDGPGLISSLRNNIVHAKRKQSKGSKKDSQHHLTESIRSEAKAQALQLALWYIEMSLLRILDYKGKYRNRVGSSRLEHDRIEYVPWVAGSVNR